jgi:hypothetical protein
LRRPRLSIHEFVAPEEEEEEAEEPEEDQEEEEAVFIAVIASVLLPVHVLCLCHPFISKCRQLDIAILCRLHCTKSAQRNTADKMYINIFMIYNIYNFSRRADGLE